MISIAAELAGMHPQTLRIYEQRGLIKPKRSAKQTRLYSRSDVDRLRQIQQLTSEMGMNLAGVVSYNEYESGNDPYPLAKNYMATDLGMGGPAPAGPEAVASGSKDVIINTTVTYEIVSPL